MCPRLVRGVSGCVPLPLVAFRVYHGEIAERYKVDFAPPLAAVGVPTVVCGEVGVGLVHVGFGCVI